MIQSECVSQFAEIFGEHISTFFHIQINPFDHAIKVQLFGFLSFQVTTRPLAPRRSVKVPTTIPLQRQKGLKRSKYFIHLPSHFRGNSKFSISSFDFFGFFLLSAFSFPVFWSGFYSKFIVEEAFLHITGG